MLGLRGILVHLSLIGGVGSQKGDVESNSPIKMEFVDLVQTSLLFFGKIYPFAKDFHLRFKNWNLTQAQISIWFQL